jgi:caa(3)-type oxidase subunit IV
MLTGHKTGTAEARLNGGVVGLLVAAIQAVLVAMLLIHLRWSPSLVRLFALAGVSWMSILMAGTLDDVLTRG